MNIGSAFHSYNLTQAVQTAQPPVTPVEKPSASGHNQPRQNQQVQQPNNSSLDSLGGGKVL